MPPRLRCELEAGMRHDCNYLGRNGNGRRTIIDSGGHEYIFVGGSVVEKDGKAVKERPYLI